MNILIYAFSEGEYNRSTLDSTPIKSIVTSFWPVICSIIAWGAGIQTYERNTRLKK